MAQDCKFAVRSRHRKPSLPCTATSRHCDIGFRENIGQGQHRFWASIVMRLPWHRQSRTASSLGLLLESIRHASSHPLAAQWFRKLCREDDEGSRHTCACPCSQAIGKLLQDSSTHCISYHCIGSVGVVFDVDDSRATWVKPVTSRKMSKQTCV